MIWVHLQTIFSFRSYHLLAFATRKHRALFAVYLFLLSLLVFYFFSGSFIHRNLPVFLKNFPQITFEKGVLTSPSKPVVIPIPQSPFQLVFEAGRKMPPTLNELTESQTLVWISGNTLYMPGANGLQAQPLPPTLNFTTTPEFLKKNQPVLAASLRFFSFIMGILFIPFIFLFDFCIAASVGLFFNLLRARRVSRNRILTWAFFLLGPLSALWFVRLWVTIPLFTLAQIFLCIIYMQQIFNTFPEEN